MSNDGRSNALGGRHGFLGFVPALVIKNILDQKNMMQQSQIQGAIAQVNTVPELPIKQELRSVVMFADISGFTNLTESYSKIGPEGNEIIAFAINRYMELMVQEIGKSGGDIFKFAGDAMIVVWPPPPDEKKTEQDKDQFLLNSCHLAVQSAMNIQKKLKETKIVDQIMLSVKIGFGIGDFSIIYVGGVLNRAEYLPAGNPLIQAFESESHAEKGGVVIISEEVEHYLRRENYFDMQEVTKKDDKKKFFQVLNTKQKVRNVSASLQIKDQLSPTQIEIIRPDVERYIPKALKMYINLGLERWSSELRWLTVLFMNIGIDLNHIASQEGLNRIQKVIECIQKCVYLQEGSLNKFLMDDKGSTMIVVFGLPPTSHEDDAARAVLCAQQIYKSLKKMNCKCSIGISSGLVFAGVVGTSGNRREYSVIGDSVNLSARIMSCACKEKDKRILVDETTTKQAMNKIDFKFWDWKKFKGKSMYLPIYEPLFYSSERMKQEYKDNYFPQIRTHRYCYPIWNPKLLDKPNDDGTTYTPAPIIQNKKLSVSRKMLNVPLNANASNIFFSPQVEGGGFLRDTTHSMAGTPLLNKQHDEQKKQLNLYKTIVLSEDKFQKAYGIFKQFMKGLQNQQIKGKIMRCKGFTLIKGPVGVGKSLFLRRLLLSIHDDIHKKTYMKFKYDESVQIIVSSINSKTSKYKCNGMRKPIKTLFKLLMKRMNVQDTSLEAKITFLYNQIPLLQNQSQNMQTTIKQLFGLEKFNLLARFDAPSKISKENQISVGEDSDERIKNEYMLIAKLVRQFFSSYLEQKEHYEMEGHIHINNARGSFNPKNFVAPLIIVLEDIHNYDVYSFKMIRTLLKYFDNIQFFATARTNYFEKPVQVDANPKTPMQEDIYQDGVSSVEELLLDMSVDLYQVIELNNFSFKESEKIKELLKVVLNIDNVSYKNKNDRDESDDIDLNTISFLFYSQIKERLQEYPKLFFYYFLQFKTNGNPLLLLDCVESFLDNKLLLMAGKNISQEELEKEGYKTSYNYRKTVFITEELRNLMLCEEFITINSPLIKRKIYGPILDQIKTEELLIMKIASVIGTVFDFEMLSKVQPFKELIKNDQLIDLLTNLEQNQFIEIVEHNSNNIYFRCTHPYIREVIYQRMDFSQRRQLHINVADNIQTMTQLENSEQYEKRRLLFHLKLGENARRQTLRQDDKQIELKAKTAIIVKKVTNLLKQSSNRSDRMCVLHSSILNKKSDRGVTKADRYVILTIYDLRYYHNIKEFEDSPQEFLASILLKDIISIEKSKVVQGQTEFILHAEKWYKKDQLKNSKRIFSFSSNEEDIFDEWQIYIEYAKTYQQFSYFTQNFGKIQLPLEIASVQQQQLYRWYDYERRNRQTNKERSTSMRLPKNFHGGRLTLNKSKLSVNIRKIKNTIEDDPQNEYINNTEQIQLNKERVKTLIHKGLMLFMSHIAEMSILTDERYKKIGQSTLFHAQNPKLFKVDKEYLFQNYNPLRGDSNYFDRSKIHKSSSDEQHSNDDQASLSSDKSIPKRSMTTMPKEILTEIKEEEEENQKLRSNNKNKLSDQFYAEETAASHQPSNTSQNQDIINQMNSQRNNQKTFSVTTKYSNKQNTQSGFESRGVEDNENLFNQSSIEIKSPYLDQNILHTDPINETEAAYKNKESNKVVILQSVKEVDSNDSSSVMSNQLRRSQNRYSSLYEKYQYTQNYSSNERKDSQVYQNSDDNHNKQEFTSSSKSAELSSNSSPNQAFKINSQNNNIEAQNNNQVIETFQNLPQGQQQTGNYLNVQNCNSQSNNALKQRANKNFLTEESNKANNNNNNINNNQSQKNLSVTTLNTYENGLTSSEIKDNQTSQYTLASNQGSTVTLMNENPNFLASHSPLVIKKVRPSQWNNIPLMNLEQPESNNNINIQDISDIYHQNANCSGQQSPQKDEILTKSEFLIYQGLSSPHIQQQLSQLSSSSNQNKGLDSNTSSPIKSISQSQSAMQSINLNQVKSEKYQATTNLQVQTPSSNFEFSNSPLNNSQKMPLGAISTFKDGTLFSLTKQNQQLGFRQLQQSQLSQQYPSSPSQIIQGGVSSNNSNLYTFHNSSIQSTCTFAPSPCFHRSSTQLQFQQAYMHQMQQQNQQPTNPDSSQIQSLLYINQLSNQNIDEQTYLSSQAERGSSEAISSDKIISNNNYIQQQQNNIFNQQNNNAIPLVDNNNNNNNANQKIEVVQQDQRQQMQNSCNFSEQTEASQDKYLQSPSLKSEKGKVAGQLSINLRKSVVSTTTQVTSERSEYKQKEETSQNEIQRQSISAYQPQSQIIQNQPQNDFSPNQSNEIYSFNMKNNINSSHINNTSDQISPRAHVDSQHHIILNKNISVSSNITGQFNQQNNQSTTRLDYVKNDYYQQNQDNTNTLIQNMSASQNISYPFQNPYIVSEVNQNAMTRQTSISVRGDKLILTKMLQVKILKFYSDDTVEVNFEGVTAIFPKKDFILLNQNSSVFRKSESQPPEKKLNNNNNTNIQTKKNQPNKQMLYQPNLNSKSQQISSNNNGRNTSLNLPQSSFQKSSQQPIINGKKLQKSSNSPPSQRKKY
ncbi:hypothetical protein ABPG72_011131 [Tetrahymena utriculariae]